MDINIYSHKDEYNYIVQLGDSVFEMNENANLPNGVNMYCGEDLQIDTKKYKKHFLGDLSKGMLIAIIHRLTQHIDLIEEWVLHQRIKL